MQRTVISFSERGNPRRYTLDVGEGRPSISSFHSHMLNAMSGHHRMRSRPPQLSRLDAMLEQLANQPMSEQNPLEIINTIPSYKAEGDLNECSVCQDKIKTGEDFRRLPCSDTVNHCFHTKCIDPWLKSNTTCPNCRSNVM